MSDDQPHSRPAWRDNKSKWLPPLLPMVVAAWLSVLVVHLLASLLGLEIPSVFLILADLLVIAVAAIAGWQLRRLVTGSNKQLAWDQWEESVGTQAIAFLALVLAVMLLVWALLGRLEWLGSALAVLMTAAIAVAWVAGRTPSESLTVIPEGEQPEPLEDFQRVELDWSLEPQLPEMTGKAGLWIKKSTVDGFRSKNPIVKWNGSLPQFDWYVDAGVCDEVNALADRLMAVSRQHGLSRYFEVCLVLNLVQSIRYMTDMDSKGIEDYWRFPLETLSDGCGDCEDFAILAVALLSAMGHRTCFFDLPHHVATGVAALPEETGVSFEATDGVSFYFVETTAQGWRIGELPSEISRDSMRIAAVVAPLRARQPERRLTTMEPDRWRIDSASLVRGGLAVGIVGSALAMGLNLLS